MFDLSWSHIAILVVVALLVLGPKELPNAIRTGAQLLRTGRKLANEFRSGMDDLLREAELEETRRVINQAMSEGVEKTLVEHVDPTGEIQGAVAVDPLTEASIESGPKLIEHEAPPAPPHSILPPAEEPVPPAAPPGQAAGAVSETPAPAQSLERKQEAGA